MKKAKKMLSLLALLGVITAFTSCSDGNEYTDFIKNGWDGSTAPSESVLSDADSQTGTDSQLSTDRSTQKGSDSSTKATSPESTRRANVTTTKKADNTATTTKRATSGTVTTTATAQMSVPEILNLYKTAANKIKTTEGITCTRTKSVITLLSGSIPAEYQAYGFTPGTDETRVRYNTSAKIKSSFCVEGKNYVCDLSYSDILSASVTANGNTSEVTINIKNDSPGTYDRSSKCVSTITPVSGTWTCKGVVLKGTVNSNGQLVSLYTNMPVYVTDGSSFAFSVEEYWTISY